MPEAIYKIRMKFSALIDQLIREIGPARVRRPGGQIEQPGPSWIKWTTVSDAATLHSRLGYKELARISLPVTGIDENDLSIDDSLVDSVRVELLKADLLGPKDRPRGLAFMPDPYWLSPITVSFVVFGVDE